MSVLQKLARIIKDYNSDHCLDYAQVQESMGNICLITADVSRAKTHFKKAMKIYEDVWADEPELIEQKYKEIQELYPQIGIALAQFTRRNLLFELHFYIYTPINNTYYRFAFCLIIIVLYVLSISFIIFMQPKCSYRILFTPKHFIHNPGFFSSN